MFRRTTIALALVAGALCAGVAVTAQSTGDRLSLAATQVGTVPVKPGQFTVSKPVQAAPAKPVSAAPVKRTPVTVKKPDQFTTAGKTAATIDKGRLTQVALTRATPEAKCSVAGGGLFGSYNFNLVGRGYYRTVPGYPGFYEWYRFEYELGTLIDSGADSNNITVRMFESGRQRFTDSTQEIDVRRFNTRYVLEPTSPIYTRTTSPVTLEFSAIFDRPRRGDPNCTAHTTGM
jgi:hypothetical protein